MLGSVQMQTVLEYDSIDDVLGMCSSRRGMTKPALMLYLYTVRTMYITCKPSAVGFATNVVIVCT